MAEITHGFDLLIVGSGLYGAVIAHEAKEYGLKCLVLERRQQVGGNVRDEWTDGICVHQYGAHIFHTYSEEVWNYVNHFAKFVPYHHTVMARVGKRMYHLPFSLQTFYDVFGITNPHEIDEVLRKEREREYYPNPLNLEQQAVNLVGRTVYDLPWHIGREAYYPVNNASNKKLYEEYKKLIAARYPSIVLGGRLGNYRYYDMDDAISDALIAFRHNYYPSKM